MIAYIRYEAPEEKGPNHFTARQYKKYKLVAVIGLAVILARGALNYLISLALFKEPMSKWAQGARLRKQM